MRGVPVRGSLGNESVFSRWGNKFEEPEALHCHFSVLARVPKTLGIRQGRRQTKISAFMVVAGTRSHFGKTESLSVWPDHGEQGGVCSRPNRERLCGKKGGAGTLSPGQWRARNAFPAMEVPSRVREEGWGAGGCRRDHHRTG